MVYWNMGPELGREGKGRNWAGIGWTGANEWKEGREREHQIDAQEVTSVCEGRGRGGGGGNRSSRISFPRPCYSLGLRPCVMVGA